MTEASWNFLIGIVCLWGGAELLVFGARRLALGFGVSTLVIGLTIVSAGTSLPEAVASLMAQIQGDSGDIALGNVIGSNVANIGLILGVGALIRPVEIPKDVKLREMPVMLAVTCLLFFMMFADYLGRIDGVCLLALLLGYLVAHFVLAKGASGEKADRPELTKTEVAKDICLIALGIVILVVGGKFFLQGAISVAMKFGMTPAVIGLTLVALGTSLPELATTVVAALRRDTDLILGNVVGSNIFNILFIVGLVALLFPIYFSQTLLTTDFPVLLGFSFLLMALMVGRTHLSRPSGALLVLLYFAYMGYLVVYS